MRPSGGELNNSRTSTASSQRREFGRIWTRKDSCWVRGRRLQTGLQRHSKDMRIIGLNNQPPTWKSTYRTIWRSSGSRKGRNQRTDKDRTRDKGRVRSVCQRWGRKDWRFGNLGRWDWRFGSLAWQERYGSHRWRVRRRDASTEAPTDTEPGSTCLQSWAVRPRQRPRCKRPKQWVTGWNFPKLELARSFVSESEIKSYHGFHVVWREQGLWDENLMGRDWIFCFMSHLLFNHFSRSINRPMQLIFFPSSSCTW